MHLVGAILDHTNNNEYSEGDKEKSWSLSGENISDRKEETVNMSEEDNTEQAMTTEKAVEAPAKSAEEDPVKKDATVVGDETAKEKDSTSEGNDMTKQPLLAEAASTEGEAPDAAKEKEKHEKAEFEARAIAEAAASADAAYVPSPSLLDANSPEPLLDQVDGPSLKGRIVADSIYSARMIPIPVRKSVDVPIHVTTAGSVVEYRVESERYDVGFGIRAERESSTTVVIETDRVDSHLEPITGKFLVGTVPCALIFTFDNEYSWLREKLLSYKIVVKTPTLDMIKSGRRRRAQSALESVSKDLVEIQSKFVDTEQKRKELELSVAELRSTLKERTKELESVETEEKHSKRRMDIRITQETMLNERLTKGWADEKLVDEEEDDDDEEEEEERNGNGPIEY